MVERKWREGLYGERLANSNLKNGGKDSASRREKEKEKERRKDLCGGPLSLDFVAVG